MMSTKWTSIYSFYVLSAKKVRKMWKSCDNTVDLRKAIYANAKWSRTALSFSDITKMVQSQDTISSLKKYMSIDYAVIICINDGQYVSFCAADMTFLFLFFSTLSWDFKKEFFELYKFFDEIVDRRLYDAVVGCRGAAKM